MFLQVLTVLISMSVATYGFGVGYGGGGAGGYGFGGGSGGHMGMAAPEPFRFGYQANGDGANHFRQEEGDESGNVSGSYGYTDSQGLYRKVVYSAGAGGFKASVHTNEPGTDSKPESPADVQMNAQQPPAGIQNKYTRQGGMSRNFGAGSGAYGGMGSGSFNSFAGIPLSGSGKSIH